MVDMSLEAGFDDALSFPPHAEVGVYCVEGSVTASAEEGSASVYGVGDLGVFETTSTRGGGAGGGGNVIRLAAEGEAGARVVVLGGTREEQPLHMLWNFVARDKAQLAVAKDAWQALDRSVFPEVVNEDNKDSVPMP